MVGLIPSWSIFGVKKTLGKSWSATAVEAGLLAPGKVPYNAEYAVHDDDRIPEVFRSTGLENLRTTQGQLAFLFGIDDHWGPLSLFEEMSKQAPDIHLSIEREGPDHAFSCTEVGSEWVAQHVASLIKKCTSTSWQCIATHFVSE